MHTFLQSTETVVNLEINPVRIDEHGKRRSVVLWLLAASLTSKVSSLDMPT